MVDDSPPGALARPRAARPARLQIGRYPQQLDPRAQPIQEPDVLADTLQRQDADLIANAPPIA